MSKATDLAIQDKVAEINEHGTDLLTIIYEGQGLVRFVLLAARGLQDVSKPMTRREALTWLNGYFIGKSLARIELDAATPKAEVIG